jgi:hypothetical protein
MQQSLSVLRMNSEGVGGVKEYLGDSGWFVPVEGVSISGTLVKGRSRPKK